jgi:hypothetical protein
MKIKTVHKIPHQRLPGDRYLERRPMDGKPVFPAPEVYVVVHDQEIRIQVGDTVRWYTQLIPIPGNERYCTVHETDVFVNDQRVV